MNMRTIYLNKYDQLMNAKLSLPIYPVLMIGKFITKVSELTGNIKTKEVVFEAEEFSKVLEGVAYRNQGYITNRNLGIHHKLVLQYFFSNEDTIINMDLSVIQITQIVGPRNVKVFILANDKTIEAGNFSAKENYRVKTTHIFTLDNIEIKGNFSIIVTVEKDDGWMMIDKFILKYSYIPKLTFL